MNRVYQRTKRHGFRYAVLTPIGLFRRFIANDPMGRRFDRSVETYWTPRETEEGTERYFKQF